MNLEERQPEVLTLQGEDGKDYRFLPILSLDVDEKAYYILQPLDMQEHENALIALQVEQQADGSLQYLAVEDDAVLDRISEEFERCLEAGEHECSCCGHDCEDCGHDCGEADACSCEHDSSCDCGCHDHE